LAENRPLNQFAHARCDTRSILKNRADATHYLFAFVPGLTLE
jgi:hypothetical protein